MSRRDEDTLLRALLGPKGPELSCEDCFERLDRYVELELAGVDADDAVPACAAPRGLPGWQRGPPESPGVRAERLR